MDSPCAPYKERSSQGSRLTGEITSQSEARMEKPKSPEETHQTRITHTRHSLGVSQVPWDVQHQPMGQRRGKGWGCHGQSRTGSLRCGRRGVHESRAKPRLQPGRGEVREGRREQPPWMLCCINGLEMSRDSSARGDTEGTFAPAHIMRIVKEQQPQKKPFVLLLCSLLLISRKLPFVRLNLQEDFRIPGLLMPLPNTRQQYPESLDTLMANLYQIP